MNTMMPEGAATVDPLAMRRIWRALRALRISGRRLMERKGEWSVRREGRPRPIARLLAEDVALLAADGKIMAAEGGGYILTAEAVEEVTAAEACEPVQAGDWIYAPAGRRRRRTCGAGFSGLAKRALAGEGPLSLRQAAAGLKLVCDAEQAGRDPFLTMDWDAGPADKQRRSGRAGGLNRAAREAERRITRLRTALGKSELAFLWSACVEQLNLFALETRHGLGRRAGVRVLAAALEKLAAAYDG